MDEHKNLFCKPLRDRMFTETLCHSFRSHKYRIFHRNRKKLSSLVKIKLLKLCVYVDVRTVHYAMRKYDVEEL